MTMTAHNKRILAAALEYQDRGFPLVLCDGKRPQGLGWQADELNGDDLAARLNGKKPQNIGLILNQAAVMDVECDDEQAEQALQGMFPKGIPPTPTYKSNRGLHRLFVKPAQLPDTAVVKIDGVEFRIGNNGKGAMSVLPPSIHPTTKRAYEWLPGLGLDDVEPAELPQAIAKQLLTKKAAAAAATPGADSAEGKTIPVGERNNALFRFGCHLMNLEVRLPPETIEATLLDLNARLCVEPLPAEEVKSIADSVVNGEVRQSFTAQLLEDSELWHDKCRSAFITFTQGHHRETHPIGSRLSEWLRYNYHRTTGSMLPSQATADLCALLKGKALFEGPEYPRCLRAAQLGEAIYLDLVDPLWRVVEIDAQGWRVLDESPVRFVRGQAAAALPEPQPTDRSLKELLLPFVNVHKKQWPLAAMWLLTAIRGWGPYPVMKLVGEQGSAKSTTARFFRRLVDPNASLLRTKPRTEDDLFVSASHNHVICLDNLSTITPELSDSICRVSTGGGLSKRSHYTEDGETVLDALRPVILASIEEIGPRSDLLERSLIIELPVIKNRKDEDTLLAEFDAAAPEILGAALNIVSAGLKRLPEIKQRGRKGLSRMADFHLWGMACEEALGLKPGEFTTSYQENQARATEIVLCDNPVIERLLQVLEEEGDIKDKTAKQLLWTLQVGVDDRTGRAPGWPKTPRVLSALLRRVAPNLRQIGVTVNQHSIGRGNDRRDGWSICQTERGGAGAAGGAKNTTTNMGGKRKNETKERKKPGTLHNRKRAISAPSAPRAPKQKRRAK